MKPVIIGCRTENFSEDQLSAFRKHQPFGMILFSEPCRKGPAAIRHVIAQFKSACPAGRIFIDAEGGAVNRLKPEFGHGWRDVPEARKFAKLATSDIQAAQREIFTNARMIGKDLASLGIDVNCAPVADLVRDDVISKTGDDGKPHATSASLYRRSFGHDPDIVSECVRAFVQGMESAGVCAVVKHVPGYGRVSADPHYAQSGIETPLAALEETDFRPFHNLCETRAMMTGHVLYKSIDPVRCSTISRKVIDVIRSKIAFKGVLIADTIEMNSIWPEGFSKTEKDQFGMGLPLKNTLTFVTHEALKAGCDLVMHSDCSRDFSHTLEVLEAAHELSEDKSLWMLEKMTVYPA